MPAVATAGGLPTRLGKYEIMMPLAAGGMARIYIGRTTGIGSFERHVVLKLITPERANDHTAVQMFLDEARLAAALNHQNVAQVFEVGEDLGIHYLAMEYVHGQDLRALLAKAGSQGTRVPLDLALTVVTGAAAGLEHAHERRGPDGVPLGIVHRDVSPSNIMIGYDGSVKLLDFGIAKATARSIETQSGIIKGKFAYMAPEQCRGRDVDRRSDVFSLGIILYEITTQHRCFRADSDFDTMHRIVTGDVVRPTRLIQGYPQALEAIVMKALAVDPTQRYQSSGLLLEAIESFTISARMGLSTMSLGRFMRDMFGDLQEPWLNNSGRNAAPVLPKESTISNTNGTGTGDVGARAQPPPSADSAQMAASTVLDLPRGEGGGEEDAEPEPSAAEWNAKSYPTMHPPIESVRQSSPAVPVVQPATPRGPVTPAGGYPAQPPRRDSQPLAAAGSHPMPPVANSAGPVVPLGQFPNAGSGSHSAAMPMPMPSTRHGYASAAQSSSGISYPRYEPPADAEDLHLKPNRRPLFIGLGIALVGLIALLAVSLGGGGDGGDDEDRLGANDGSANLLAGSSAAGSDSGSAGNVIAPIDEPTVPPDPTPDPKPKDPPKKHGSSRVGSGEGSSVDGTGEGSDIEVVPDPAEATVTIEVTSDPEGADVILAGKVIGSTPLKVSRPRGSGRTTITIHKATYADISTEIDLADDYSSEVTLKLLEEPKKPDKPRPDIKKPDKPRPDRPRPDIKKPKPTKPACQTPSLYNPLDSRPVCK